MMNGPPRPAIPVGPIFVWDPGDLVVFDTVAQAESYLEPVDVRAGAYTAFDYEGRRLHLGVEPSVPKGGWWHVELPRVVITCAEELPSGQMALREILERFLGSLGEDPASLRTALLSELQVTARARALR